MESVSYRRVRELREGDTTRRAGTKYRGLSPAVLEVFDPTREERLARYAKAVALHDQIDAELLGTLHAIAGLERSLKTLTRKVRAIRKLLNQQELPVVLQDMSDDEEYEDTPD